MLAKPSDRLCVTAFAIQQHSDGRVCAVARLVNISLHEPRAARLLDSDCILTTSASCRHGSTQMYKDLVDVRAN